MSPFHQCSQLAANYMARSCPIFVVLYRLVRVQNRRTSPTQPQTCSAALLFAAGSVALKEILVKHFLIFLKVVEITLFHTVRLYFININKN